MPSTLRSPGEVDDHAKKCNESRTGGLDQGVRTKVGSRAPASPPDEGLLPFTEFVGARSDKMLELAWLITRDAEDARDAVQDVLASLYPRWSRLPAGDEFEAYVYRSVVNACLRVLRRRGRSLPVAEPERLRSAPVIDDPSVEVGVRDQVWRLCGELEPRQRTAVILRFFADLSFAEIAAAIGCREATARSHVRRALARMRTHLEEER